MDKRMYVNQSVFEQLEEKLIGWLVKTHHRHNNRAELAERMTKEINRQLQEDPSFGLDSDSPAKRPASSKKKKAGLTAANKEDNNLQIITEEYRTPAFKVVIGKVMLFEKDNTVFLTDALRIRCKAKEGNRVRNLLSALSESKHPEFDNFVPFGIANTNTATLKKLIKIQTKFLEESQLVKIVGLLKEGLETEMIEEDSKYLSMWQILVKGGILSVSQSPGFGWSETLLVVKKKDFEATKSWIDELLDELCDDSMIDLSKLLGKDYTRIRRVHVGGAATGTVISYMTSLDSRCAGWTDSDMAAIPNCRPLANAWQQRGPPS